jgi:copper transport protein
MRRWPYVALVAAVLASMLLPMWTSRAEAHAALVRANPSNNEQLRRPPTRVVLDFSEPVERELTKIEVTNQGGDRVDEGESAFDDANAAFASVGLKDLGPGLYFVHWSNVSSVDGHAYEGRYPFVVLKADGSFPDGVSPDDLSGSSTSGGDLLPKNIDVTLKWISLTSLAVVVGAAIFLAFTVRPAARFLEDERYQEVIDANERWVVNLSHLLLPAAFISMSVLVLVTVSRFETSTSLWTYLTDVETGRYRLAMLAATVVALAGADLLFLGSSRRKRDAGILLLILAGGAAMLTFSLVSHSATGRGHFWSVASDFVHFAASSVWLGALVMLVPALRWRKDSWQEHERFLYLANMFDRFSIAAGISVTVVLATGVFNGLAQVPTWDALTGTTYGKVLLAKLAIIAPLLAVAGLNAFVLKPRLVTAIDGLYQEGGIGDRGMRETESRELLALRRWLPRTVIAEIALVVAVFAAVGVLSQTSTAKGEIAQEAAAKSGSTAFNQASQADGLGVTLQVGPNQSGGINNYTVKVDDASGQPSATVTQVRLRFNYDDIPGAIAQSELLLTQAADGSWQGSGAYFSQPGNWRTEVGVRRSDGDDVSKTFVLPVVRPPVIDTGEGGAFDLPFKSLQWNEVVGAALVILGALAVIYRKPFGWTEGTARQAALAGAALLFITGGVLYFGVDQHGQALNARNGNPIQPNEQSVARGRELFQANCIVCHGVDGRGDGPAAANLDPAPTDFRLHMPLHTDVQFYNFIADGYPGSAMTGFKDQFSADDIWNIVNFLRSAFSEAPTQ